MLLSNIVNLLKQFGSPDFQNLQNGLFSEGQLIKIIHSLINALLFKSAGRLRSHANDDHLRNLLSLLLLPYDFGSLNAIAPLHLIVHENYGKWVLLIALRPTPFHYLFNRLAPAQSQLALKPELINKRFQPFDSLLLRMN